jgi:tripartite-type tricarboxylate transporter receptor subunit TctC
MDRRTFVTLAAASAANAASPASAQFTSGRPIRLIIPLAVGGATDSYARLIVEHMARTLQRPVIVEHKPGGSGIVGSQYVVDQPADGNLLLLVTQATTEILSHVQRDMKWSLNDFIPLIRGVTSPLVLVANPSVPAKSLAELVAWIKQNPGKLSYSSYTAGTPSHFLGYQMNERFGLDLLHVPSKGSGFQMTDMIAGHVQFGFAQTQSSLPFLRDGKLRAIAITDEARSRHMPDVPTFAELGYAEFTARVWFGLSVRAGTPAPIVESLLAAAKAAHADADVRSKLDAQGFDMSGQTGPELAEDIRKQSERWARLIKASGYKAD